MRIALAVVPTTVGDAVDNLAALHGAMRSVAGRCDLLVVGEAFVQGFDALTDDPAHDLAVGWSLEAPLMAQVRGWARDLGLAVCLGLVERHAGHLHSSAVLVGADGLDVHVHRRVSRGWHAPDADASVYVDAALPGVFTVAGHRFAIALCGDLWDHEEAFRALGVDVLLWPVHVEWTPQAWAERERAAYAERAGSVAPDVLLVNCLTAGSDTEKGAHGGAAWFRGGAVHAEQPMGTPGVLLVDVP